MPPSQSSLRDESVRVLLRFALRLAILALFAAFGSHGFAATFAQLLGLGTMMCAVIACMRREIPFDPVLSHWDEAAAYTMSSLLLLRLS
jgi:hypothetical protein